jgi:hypothetical protein
MHDNAIGPLGKRDLCGRLRERILFRAVTHSAKRVADRERRDIGSSICKIEGGGDYPYLWALVTKWLIRSFASPYIFKAELYQGIREASRELLGN